jgi:nucleoside-diphosphate-sugar epimerase
MRILFTGASSFTGLWFVRELVRAGHEVVAPLRRRLEDYADVRRRRVEQLTGLCRTVFQCPFGETEFTKMLKDRRHWDLFCHHAADVTDYKSADFDPASALANNTRNLRAILADLAETGCRRMVLTGSVFEPLEGAGGEGLRAVSPYGLSKGLTSQMVGYYAELASFRLGKFVIPNPFGPYEEPRFTSYLVRSWQAGQSARWARTSARDFSSNSPAK